MKNVLWTGSTVEGDTLEIRLVDSGAVENLAAVEGQTWAPSQAASTRTLFARALSPRTLIFAAFSASQKRCVGFITGTLLEPHQFSKSFAWTHYAELCESPAAKTGREDCFYIVSITSHPDAPRGTATLLLETVCRTAKHLGLTFVRSGIRLPQLAIYSAQGISAEAYLEGLERGVYQEPLFRLALKTGGKPIGLIPGYYDDPESLNYGLCVEHRVAEPAL